MRRARVVGNLWASSMCPALKGHKLLILREDLPGGKKDYFIAVDTMDAGIGDEVLTVTGSSARQSRSLKGSPSDTAVIGIIDPPQKAGS